MSRICGMCGKKGHNIRTCKDREILDSFIVNKGSRIYIPMKLIEGDSIIKSKLLKRFDDTHEYKKWNGNKWVSVPLNIKIRDNKYKIIHVSERQDDEKNIKVIQYILQSKRDKIKWAEIKSKSFYRITTPFIQYKEVDNFK